MDIVLLGAGIATWIIGVKAIAHYAALGLVYGIH